MSKPFFITRQTTDLMEGFARDLQAQASLFLIYGDEGIGKTRLLEQLAQTHLKDCKVRWMDLKAGSSGDGARVDSSVMIEKTFASAEPGDIIVADHFEMALKKTRHQLFLSWSTDGIDKQLSMIVAANTDYFNELRQLSKQYQIQVQSFQQLPFSDDEAAAFLGFYLFPDRPSSQLSVPPLLRNQLSMTQGRVGKIVEIAERAGDQITTLPVNNNAPIKQDSRVIVGVLIALAVAVVVAIGWYFISSKAQIDEMTIAEPGSPLVEQQQEMPLPVETEVEAEQALIEVEVEVVEVATENSTHAVSDSDAPQSIDAPQLIDTGDDTENVSSDELESDLPEVSAVDPAVSASVADDSVTEALLLASGTELTAAEEVQPLASSASNVSVSNESASDAVSSGKTQAQPQQDGNAVEDSKVAKVEETVVDTAAASVIAPRRVSSGSVALSLPDRLQRDLQTSLDWINRRDSSVGTLQILLLSQKKFKEDGYYEYLDRLAGEGVDLAELKIFETFTSDQRVFSVVFGEYPNRRSAANAKPQLPKILRDASPVPRSVGGLMKEMRRLEGKN